MSTPEETPILTREAMNRIAEAQGATITATMKGRNRCLHVRDQGVVLYLGYEHVLVAMSEEAFAAKIVKRLADAMEVR